MQPQHNQNGQQASQRFGIPELRNPRYLMSFQAGRRARFMAELGGPGRRARFMAELGGLDVSTAPLYSHNATHQSLFSKGWGSVTPVQIFQARHRRAQQARSTQGEPHAASHP